MSSARRSIEIGSLPLGETAQNLGDRAAALLSGIPGHEDRTRPVGELREIDPTAAVDHYHEVRVELRHGGDLGGLSFGQGEGAVVVFPFGIAVEAGAVDHRVGRREPPLAIRRSRSVTFSKR